MFMPDRSQSLLIAPWIEIPSLRRWIDEPDSAALLERHGLTLGPFVQNFLDSLQAHIPGNVPLGYTISVNVYELFSKNAAGEFHFDPSRMAFFTDLFLAVGRPVVVNLRANHFVGDDAALLAELTSHPSSFALLNDGSPVRDDYYYNPVFAPNFSLDENIPLNRYRFGGFQAAVTLLAEFDREHPGILHAVTLAGEIHHFLPELANPQAAGQFEGARMTDYSPESVRDFSTWLQTRHNSLAQFNSQFGTPFATWDEIDPPRHDLRTTPDAPAWSHMDSYANGLLPVFGWMKPPFEATLRVFIDGEPVALAEYGLSRLDVYDAVPELAESDVGFRVDVDYRKLAPGRHVLHVILERPGGERLRVGDRRFTIEGPSGSVPAINVNHLNRLPECSGFAWLDHPPNDLRLRLNSYAFEWHEFREYQVNSLLLKFTDIAIQSGLSPDKLFSHQIMPHFEGSWNRVAFAVPARPPLGSRFSPGINLYGGSAVYRGMRQYLQVAANGVPELHPRMGKSISRDVFRRTLEYHRELGATFLSPYFMGLREPQGRRYMSEQSNLAEALLIHPLNIAVGSMYFYTALVKFLNSPPAL
jgi:hypothetical protein